LYQAEFGGWDDTGEEVVALWRLDQVVSVDPVDLPHVDRPSRVVHPNEPVAFPLVGGEKATLLLRPPAIPGAAPIRLQSKP